MLGSRVNIWKQDPSVSRIGIRSSFIHTKVQNGPKDNKIIIKGMPTVIPDGNGDFLFYPQDDSLAFDAVHTFSVVRQVLTMYTRGLKRLGVSQAFKWQWGRGALQVYPRAGEDTNAYYSRSEKSLKFYYFRSANHNGRKIYTNRSFDIVAHETGHAILDAIRPGYFGSWHAETGGLHEAFGDLTAIFTMLSQMDLCEAIITESKLDLHTKTFFPALAEEFGYALYGHDTGLRNADNDLTMDEVSTQVHDISKVFTGAVYDILADIFSDHLDLEHYDPAETLFRVGRYLLSVLIIAIFRGPAQNARYRDIAEQMIEAMNGVPKWQEFARARFEERKILGGQMAFAASEPQELDWTKCGKTLQSDEFQKLFAKALKKAKK